MSRVPLNWRVLCSWVLVMSSLVEDWPNVVRRPEEGGDVSIDAVANSLGSTFVFLLLFQSPGPLVAWIPKCQNLT